MDAPLRPCANPACKHLVVMGLCPQCRQGQDRGRGSRQSRGYDREWEIFRNVTFPSLLSQYELIPMCGIALPGGPSMAYSACKAHGIYTFTSLHLDHEPPLTPTERGLSAYYRRGVVCNPYRVGYLCVDCHQRKTLAERHGTDSWRQGGEGALSKS